MATTSKLLKSVWRLNRLERAVRRPARYAKNRAKSKALGAVGFWKLLSKVWLA